MNKVTLIGRLGKDPEVRYTTTGTAVASVALATSEKMKDKDGQWQDHTEWHNLVLWGRKAEIAGEYLTKGSQIAVVGKLRTRKWEKDGVTRYSTEILVDELEMLGKKDSGNGNGQREASGSSSTANNEEYQGYDSDDIPF